MLVYHLRSTGPEGARQSVAATQLLVPHFDSDIVPVQPWNVCLDRQLATVMTYVNLGPLHRARLTQPIPRLGEPGTEDPTEEAIHVLAKTDASGRMGPLLDRCFGALVDCPIGFVALDRSSTGPLAFPLLASNHVLAVQPYATSCILISFRNGIGIRSGCFVLAALRDDSGCKLRTSAGQRKARGQVYRMSW